MNPLTSSDFTERDDPWALFEDWFAEASETEPRDPNAIALATVTPAIDQIESPSTSGSC